MFVSGNGDLGFKPTRSVPLVLSLRITHTHARTFIYLCDMVYYVNIFSLFLLSSFNSSQQVFWDGGRGWHRVTPVSDRLHVRTRGRSSGPQSQGIVTYIHHKICTYGYSFCLSGTKAILDRESSMAAEFSWDVTEWSLRVNSRTEKYLDKVIMFPIFQACRFFSDIKINFPARLLVGLVSLSAAGSCCLCFVYKMSFVCYTSCLLRQISVRSYSPVHEHFAFVFKPSLNHNRRSNTPDLHICYC